MLLTLYLVILAALTLFSIRLHMQQAPPVALYLLATAMLFAVGAVLFALVLVAPDTFRFVTVSTPLPTPQRAPTETYYVVVSTQRQILTMALALLPLVLVWGQTQLRALY